MVLHVAVQVEKYAFLLHKLKCRLGRLGYVGDDRGINVSISAPYVNRSQHDAYHSILSSAMVKNA